MNQQPAYSTLAQANSKHIWGGCTSGTVGHFSPLSGQDGFSFGGPKGANLGGRDLRNELRPGVAR